jgi:non-lysosomal glucosylceramidase
LVMEWSNAYPSRTAASKRSTGNGNSRSCGSGDFAKYYHSNFASLEAVVAHAAQARDDLLARTREWHSLLVDQSTLPSWLAFKVANSAYTLFTNAILNKEGRFSMMEGGMGGLAGTQDQRMVAHILYHKLFPSLDVQELAQFGASQSTVDGSINHFDADLYAGITGTDGIAPLGGQQYTDNTIGWLYQVAKTWRATADQAFLALHAPRVAAAVAFLASRRASSAFPHLISGSNTYDDFWELPLDAYLCSVYPLALEACRELALASGNASLAQGCAADRAASEAEFAASLLNPEGFFAYGAQLDGSQRRDDIMFSGSVAGAFLGRHAMQGDVGSSFSATRSSLAAQLARQVAQSYSFYAPKVFNLTSGARAIDPRNSGVSSTWPFYLESYTALAAVQAGFVDDGLAVMRYIQLVNQRLGLTWSQNLWNPWFITYVAAPVSWFSLDVLAGAGLDAVAGVLALAPLVREDDVSTNSFPVFLPQAWAVVTARRAAAGNGNGGTLTLRIVKLFADVAGGAPVTVRSLLAAPVGTAANAARAVPVSPPFVFAEGAVLDLSASFDAIVAPIVAPVPLLPPVAP